MRSRVLIAFLAVLVSLGIAIASSAADIPTVDFNVNGDGVFGTQVDTAKPYDILVTIWWPEAITARTWDVAGGTPTLVAGIGSFAWDDVTLVLAATPDPTGKVEFYVHMPALEAGVCAEYFVEVGTVNKSVRVCNTNTPEPTVTPTETATPTLEPTMTLTMEPTAVLTATPAPTATPTTVLYSILEVGVNSPQGWNQPTWQRHDLVVTGYTSNPFGIRIWGIPNEEYEVLLASGTGECHLEGEALVCMITPTDGKGEVVLLGLPPLQPSSCVSYFVEASPSGEIKSVEVCNPRYGIFLPLVVSSAP